MPLDHSQIAPLMCLTQDGTGVAHGAQAERLCSAGARWIQLRMKGAAEDELRRQVDAAAEACRRHGAVLIVNDHVEVAIEHGADGVHLGASDRPWEEARLVLGPEQILGGTVNGDDVAERAGLILDYAGVGPFRFTPTKEKLAPVLGIAGVQRLAGLLGPLPCWAIGGVTAQDLPALRAAGVRGVAVSSALHEGGRLERNFEALMAAWEAAEARAG
ncbi:MAG TPA: thiamine phosphate synthase [Opitutaceae bacterium]|jgi:thiamine-phosphate pyrophosphorylase